MRRATVWPQSHPRGQQAGEGGDCHPVLGLCPQTHVKALTRGPVWGGVSTEVTQLKVTRVGVQHEWGPHRKR